MRLQRDDADINDIHLRKKVIQTLLQTQERSSSELAEAYFFMTLTYLMHFIYVDALVYAKKCIKQNTTLTQEMLCRCWAGKCYYELGQNEKAKQEIEQIVAFLNVNKIEPKNIWKSYKCYYDNCMEIYRKITDAEH